MNSGKVERKSLCYVDRDKQERTWLYRLADVVCGELIPFAFDETKERYYGNRTRLYQKDGPQNCGFIGVWDWSVSANMANAHKDYVESYFNPSLEPVEIIELEGKWNCQKLGQALKKGLINQIPSARKVLYCYPLPEEHLGGLLCMDTDLEVDEEQGTVRLKEEIAYLDYYTLHEKNRITLHSPEALFFKDFYRFFNLGKPSKKVWVQSPGEIVKTALLKKMPWSAAKSVVTKQEWKRIREVISEVTEFTLDEEVASLCNCSREEARKYIETFYEGAEGYIEAKDIQEEALKAAMERNPQIKKACEDGLMERWKADHLSLIEQGKERIAALEESLKKTREQVAPLEKRKEELEKVTRSLEEASRDLEVKKKEQEELEEQRETLLAQIAAQEEKLSCPAAPVPLQDNGKLLEQMLENMAHKKNREAIFRPGKLLPEKEAVSYGHWRDLLSHLGRLLYGAGVMADFAQPLACFLYSSYLHGAPVLLAGPNGDAIASAFSAAVCGRMPGLLDFSMDYQADVLLEVMNSRDEVVVIKNPFAQAWSETLPSLLLPAKKFYFLTTPFSEELHKHPRGWQNYFVTVLTELVVDEMPSDNYVAGRKKPGFAHFGMKGGPSVPLLCKELCLMPYARRRLMDILGETSFLSQDEGNTCFYLFGLLPHAYLEGNLPHLRSLLEEEDVLRPVMKETMFDFMVARS